MTTIPPSHMTSFPHLTLPRSWFRAQRFRGVGGGIYVAGLAQLFSASSSTSSIFTNFHNMSDNFDNTSNYSYGSNSDQFQNFVRYCVVPVVSDDVG
jgi:hypothetical protein